MKYLSALLLTLLAASIAALAHDPITYPGMNVQVDTAGVQALDYSFDTNCAKPSPWRAQWIWTDAQHFPLVANFRKTVVLDQNPRAVKAWLTADIKYLLYINGRLVSRGPVDIGRDYAGGSTHRWFYDCRDLTPYFHAGANVITATVFRQWPIGFTVSRGQPGFLFEADLTDSANQTTTVASDESWQTQPATQFVNDNTCDLTKAANNNTWTDARVITNIWDPLIPSEIPPLMEAAYPPLPIKNLPPNHTFTHNGHFDVAFDRVLSGYPTLTVQGGAGATIKIQANQDYSFVLHGGRQQLEFPFMTEIAPSYTVEITNLTEPLKIESAAAIFTSQPVQYRGEFECSDEQINRLWNVSRWAVQICLQTHHLDSPNHQEPISDPGDYVIESMVNHYAFAQPWLARQDIRKFSWLLQDENYRNFHTSYSLAWLQMLMDYYDYTGDPSLVREMAPTVANLLDTYATWRGTNGLISQAPNYMFMDWVTIGGFECHHPPAVIGQGYLTALYYHGLEMASRVALLTGDSARADHYAQLRRQILEAFNRELWVAEKGLYRDGKPFQTSVPPGQWLPADKDIQTFSPHVNTLAVLFDLAPKESQPAIIDRVLAPQENQPLIIGRDFAIPALNTQPWFMHWVFTAIDHAGLFDKYGLVQISRWRIIPETQSFREMWNSGDLSHGWCSTPLVQMSARILGVTPATPGFKTINIAPHVFDLTWAKGKIPTPQGDVAVAWQYASNQLTLDLTIPPNSSATLTLPNSTNILAPGPHHLESDYKSVPQQMIIDPSF